MASATRTIRYPSDESGEEVEKYKLVGMFCMKCGARGLWVPELPEYFYACTNCGAVMSTVQITQEGDRPYIGALRDAAVGIVTPGPVPPVSPILRQRLADLSERVAWTSDDCNALLALARLATDKDSAVHPVCTMLDLVAGRAHQIADDMAAFDMGPVLNADGDPVEPGVLLASLRGA